MPFLSWFRTARNPSAARRAARLQARLGVLALGERIAPSAGRLAVLAPHDVHSHVAVGRAAHFFHEIASQADAQASDSGSTSSSAASATATHFLVLAQQGYAGEPDKIVVVALDASNHVVRDYQGTVALTSPDSTD